MQTPIPHLPGWLALAATLPFSNARAEDARDDIPKQIGLLVEYYEIEHTALPPLIREYHNAPNADALLATLQEMAGKGEARLVESTYLATRSGQRAKIESIREFIYPTEYDPPNVVKTANGEVDGIPPLIAPPTPTAFEMRPVGNTLEFQPAFTPGGKSIQMSVAPELVVAHGSSEWGEGVERMAQPLFHATKTVTSVTIDPGTCELLGLFTPREFHAREGEGKRWLGFATTLSLASVPRAEWERLRRNPPPEAGNSAPASPTPEPSPEPDPDGDGSFEIDRSTQIRLFTEFIEVDAALGARLIRELKDCSDATAIRLALDQVIAGGEAKVLESNELLATSEHRAKSESIREFIYPTEYTSPEIVQGAVDKNGKPVMAGTRATGNAFEMRPIGTTVEADALWDGGRWIELKFAPEIVGFSRMLTYGTFPTVCPQPLFESLKLQTAIAMPDGTAFLLGMHSLETARAGEAGTEEERAAVRDRRVLVFVTAKVKVVE